MEIKADEITAILKQQLADYEKAIDVAEVGTVLSVGDGIARIYGLDKVMAGELVDFGHDIFGLALNLEQDQVGVVLLGESQLVKEGQEVRRTRRIIQVPVGPGLVGRVVDALGRPIDDKGPIKATEFYPTERIAPGRHRSPGRQGARADGLEGDRRDDPDRPRPARADHRRPPDRQDRDRPRHDHQPEGEGRRLHLRRHRPEEVDRRAGGQDPRGTRRAGPHDHRRRRPPRTRRRCSTSRPTRAARWASSSSTTSSTR